MKKKNCHSIRENFAQHISNFSEYNQKQKMSQLNTEKTGIEYYPNIK
jgi:hypothetical protein